jgi:hypothetical protein
MLEDLIHRKMLITSGSDEIGGYSVNLRTIGYGCAQRK